MSPDASNAAQNGAAPPVAPCPLNDLPAELHQYIHALQSRIEKLEAEQVRFTNALQGAGKFIFDSPQGKMIMAAFPKTAQEGLRKFFSGNAVTENPNGNS
jgi:hypothetical protein